jgi:hypothetical protein
MDLTLIGWREFVALPELKLKNIKAKIDTGAKTSALHAEDIEYLTINNKKYVKFVYKTEEGQRKKLKARFIEERTIKSSTGQTTLRPVVKVKIKMGLNEFDIELTLINRDLMGFKMLIGRDALNNKFVINPSKSFLLRQ